MPDALTAALLEKFPRLTPRPSLDHEAVDAAPGDVTAVLQALRDAHGFDMLVDVTAVDWGEETTPRFTVVYHLYSTSTHNYVRVATACPDNEAPAAPSATGLWPAANWHERETFDMFGIRFEGHPDLRRILMWDKYPYHPLRKDFPLAGIETDLSDIDVEDETHTSTIAAPMMGGPFTAETGRMNMAEAEPRGKDQSWSEKKTKPKN